MERANSSGTLKHVPLHNCSSSLDRSIRDEHIGNYCFYQHSKISCVFDDRSGYC